MQIERFRLVRSSVTGALLAVTVAAVPASGQTTRLSTLPATAPAATRPAAAYRPVPPLMTKPVKFDSISRIAAVAVSPDGKRVAVGARDGEFRLVDVATGKAEKQLHLPKNAERVAWSPDGTLVAVLAGEEDKLEASLAKPAGDSSSARKLPDTLGATAVAFDRAGARLAVGDPKGVVTLWDVKAATPGKKLTVGTGKVCSIDFSPDGKKLAAVAHVGTEKYPNKSEVRLVNVETGATERTHARDGGVYGADDVRFSADGRRVTFKASAEALGSWDLAADAKAPPRLTMMPTKAEYVSISADGSRAVVVAGTEAYEGIAVYDTATGESIASLEGTAVYGAAVSADGRRVVLPGYSDGTVFDLSDAAVAAAVKARPATAAKDRLANVWWGQFDFDPARVAAELKRQGVTDDKMAEQLQQVLRFGKRPEVVFDLLPDGKGTLILLAGDKSPPPMPLTWKVTEDGGRAVRFHHVVGTDAPIESELRFVTDRNAVLDYPLGNAPFVPAFRLKRADRAKIKEYGEKLTEWRQSLKDATAILDGIADEASANAAAAKLKPVGERSMSLLFASSNLYKECPPLTTPIGNAHNGEFYRLRTDLTSALLRVRVQPKLDEALKGSMFGLQTDASAEIGDLKSATASEVLRAYAADKAEAKKKYEYGLYVIRGTVAADGVPKAPVAPATRPAATLPTTGPVVIGAGSGTVGLGGMEPDSHLLLADDGDGTKVPSKLRLRLYGRAIAAARALKPGDKVAVVGRLGWGDNPKPDGTVEYQDGYFVGKQE